MIKNVLKPTGKMITVISNCVSLWDFDQEFDKKKNCCKMVCQLVFSDRSKIIAAKFMDDVLLVQHEDKTLFSVIKVGLMKPRNTITQFLQLNLLSMPSLKDHFGTFNFEMHSKKLSMG